MRDHRLVNLPVDLTFLDWNFNTAIKPDLSPDEEVVSLSPSLRHCIEIRHFLFPFTNWKRPNPKWSSFNSRWSVAPHLNSDSTKRLNLIFNLYCSPGPVMCFLLLKHDWMMLKWLYRLDRSSHGGVCQRIHSFQYLLQVFIHINWMHHHCAFVKSINLMHICSHDNSYHLYIAV